MTYHRLFDMIMQAYEAGFLTADQAYDVIIALREVFPNDA